MATARTTARATLAAWLVLATASATAQAEDLILVADLNGRYGSTGYHARVTRAAETIVERRPGLVISAGDMVAGQSPSGLDTAQLEAMWGAFDAVFAQTLAGAGIPLAVTVGNHDGSGFSGFERDRAAFEGYWRKANPPPDLLPDSEWPWRYAFRHGEMLAITFDGTVPGKVKAQDRAFVQTMLERHGDEAAWTLVFAHLPFWPLGDGRERDIFRDPDFLAMLHDHGVDAYASGHHHLFFAGLDEAGMLHLSVGALGGNTRGFTGGGPRQPHGMASLERQGGELVFKALLAPDFDGVSQPTGLPEVVEGPAGTLRRTAQPVPLRD